MLKNLNIIFLKKNQSNFIILNNSISKSNLRDSSNYYYFIQRLGKGV
jgi:hypothetical protein